MTNKRLTISEAWFFCRSARQFWFWNQFLATEKKRNIVRSSVTGTTWNQWYNQCFTAVMSYFQFLGLNCSSCHFFVLLVRGKLLVAGIGLPCSHKCCVLRNKHNILGCSMFIWHLKPIDIVRDGFHSRNKSRWRISKIMYDQKFCRNSIRGLILNITSQTSGFVVWFSCEKMSNATTKY